MTKDNKKIIILEGIATSGKTTLQKLLKEKLSPAGKIKILTENVTLMPLVENKSKKIALDHIQKLLLKLSKDKADIFITDRFHFTHIFRTKSRIKYFNKIEKELQNVFKVLVITLVVDEKYIKRNIEESLNIRKNWGKGKKGTIEEKVSYYKNQQKELVKITKESNLPILKINTTEKKWNAYAEKIINKI